ncbi:MAG: hypothetical protein NXY59_01085 [Aigarchaeota archaeon]|nr:hypothetical protein [Candidatus Pelearchaeum maunauluense]
MGTFFYPWYGAGEYRHWREAGHTPPATWASNYLPDIDPATFNPARELYDSRDYEVFKWQVVAMKRAGIQFVIVSWWGIGEYEVEVFRLILKDYMKRSDNPYPSLLWAIYYEREGYGDPSISQLERDIRYILDNYAQDPNYLKVNGKPVIFVYGEGDDTFGYVNRWSVVREARHLCCLEGLSRLEVCG